MGTRQRRLFTTPAVWFRFRVDHRALAERFRDAESDDDPAASQLPPEFHAVLQPFKPWKASSCYPALHRRLIGEGEDSDLILYGQVLFPPTVPRPRGGPSGPLSGSRAGLDLDLVAKQLSGVAEVATADPFHHSQTPPWTTRDVHQPDTGVGSEFAWSYKGGTGSWETCGLGDRIRVVVLEGGIQGHSALPAIKCISTEFETKGQVSSTCKVIANSAHGTATMGVLFSYDDSTDPDQWIRGVCYEADPYYVAAGDDTVATALDAAQYQLRSNAGDVLLIEFQGEIDGHECPIEVDEPVFNAIRKIVLGLGVTIVEPAGNGDKDLRELTPPGDLTWDPTDSEYAAQDSYALIVAAGEGPPPDARKRAGTSNWGERVNCQGWGSGVRTVSTNYSSGRWDGFGGTSCASAVIAGVVACLQGAHRARHGTALSPVDVRSLLSTVSMGLDFTGGEDIGPLPDLKKLILAKVGLEVIVSDQLIFASGKSLKLGWKFEEAAKAPEDLVLNLCFSQRALNLRLRKPAASKIVLQGQAIPYEPCCFAHPFSWNRSEARNESVRLEIGLTQQLTSFELSGLEEFGIFLLLRAGVPGSDLADGPTLDDLPPKMSTEEFLQFLRKPRWANRNYVHCHVVPGNPVEVPLLMVGLLDTDAEHTLLLRFPEVKDAGGGVEFVKPDFSPEQQIDDSRGTIRVGPVKLKAGDRERLLLHWEPPMDLQEGDYELIAEQRIGATLLGRFRYIFRFKK